MQQASTERPVYEMCQCASDVFIQSGSCSLKRLAELRPLRYPVLDSRDADFSSDFFSVGFELSSIQLSFTPDSLNAADEQLNDS